MTDRLKSMRRLARVQDQVKRLAEAELHVAETRKAEIEEMALGLDDLARDPHLSSRMVSLAVGHRRRIAVRLVEAERSLAAQSEVTQEARQRVKLAERMVETLEGEVSRAQERRDLERLIEAMASREPGASLP